MWAQLNCGAVRFWASVPASFEPANPNTRTIFVRDQNGGYTGIEVTNTVPFQVVRRVQSYGEKLSSCLYLPLSVKSDPNAPLGSAILDSSAYVLPNGNIRYTTSTDFGSSTQVVFTTYTPQLDYLSTKTLTIPLARSPQSADATGDGIADLIVLEPSSCNIKMPFCGGFRIYRGIGDAVFDPTPIQIASPYVPDSIADFNGDGVPDLSLLSLYSFGRTSAIMYGQRDGSFSVPGPIPVPDSPVLRAGYSTAFATDLNADGIPDIVISSNGSFDLALGLGNGAYGKQQSFSAQSILLTADLNADGFPDFVSSNEVLLSDGKGGIAQRFAYVLGTPAYAADINRDGFPDLVTTSGDVFFGAGNGRFLAPSYAPDGSSAIVVDLDGDGIPDLAEDAGGGNLKLYRSDGMGAFASYGSGTFFGSGSYDLGASEAILLTGDWDSNGKIDVLAVPSNVYSDQTPLLRTFLNEGLGNFQPVSTAILGLAFSAVAGDWNGDGKLDIAYTTRDNLVIQMGNGDGTFNSPKILAGPGSPVVITADFNGDRIPDLLVYGSDIHSNAMLSLYTGKGDGTFASPTPVSAPAKLNGYTFLTGDFNNDGRPDVIVGADLDLAVLLGQGNGTFQQSAQLSLSYYGDGGALAADVNGDGNLDILWSASVFLGNGDGTFASENPVPWNNPVAAADFNRDGKVDVLASNPAALYFNATASTPTAVLSTTNTPGTFAPESLGTLYGGKLANGSATAVTIVDANGAQQPVPLLFASATQINFEIPTGVATGAASIQIQPPDSPPQTVSVAIQPVAPTLFVGHLKSISGDWGIGYTVRVAPDGTQTTFSSFDQANLSGANSAVFVLYGSGFRGAGPDITATVDGIPAKVNYAGLAPGLLGVDQVNIQAPSSLSSYYRDVTFRIAAAGVVSNTVVESLVANGFPQ